jgi:hypothetical protein
MAESMVLGELAEWVKGSGCDVAYDGDRDSLLVSFDGRRADLTWYGDCDEPFWSLFATEGDRVTVDETYQGELDAGQLWDALTAALGNLCEDE